MKSLIFVRQLVVIFVALFPYSVAAESVNSSTIPARAEFIQKLGADIDQRIVLYGTSLTVGGAWVSQLQSAVQSTYPGTATWINSGGSGQASNWGVANLQAKVIDQNPDAVFIEFSMNDAAESLNISRAVAIANLTTMVNGIRAAHPDCEIILQIMNPADYQPGDTFNPRANLALYQQDYRDFAASNGLLCIDHMPAFMALYDKGSAAYRAYVPDGIHPSASGWSRFMTPVLLHALGIPAQISTPAVVIDNTDAAPAIVINGTWFASSASPGFHGANYLQDGNLDKGQKSVVYTPTFATAGTYPVFLKWAASSNRATNVPVTINHSAGSNVVTVNQRNAGDTWLRIGDFPFAAGSTGSVTIGTNGTNGYVIADAVGFGVLSGGLPEVRLRMDNARAAEPTVAGGTPRSSKVVVWIPEPLAVPITVGLTYPGGTATSGADFVALPSSMTIPAGETSASVDFSPLSDNLSEGPETFRISVVSGSEYVLGSPVEANVILENSAPVLISEAFNGPATALNGKSADSFSALLTSAGGSAGWGADSGFLRNGAMSGGTGSAHLNLGSYINSARGTAHGKFVLSATLAPTTGSWLSFGFATQNAPSTSKSFSNTGAGVTTTGAATIIYRAQSGVASPNANGELDMFGFSNQNPVDGPDNNTGPRTITIMLDLTPAGGFDGTSNFGTVKWSDSLLGEIGSFTYSTSRDFGSVFISGANPFTGGISNLSLAQIQPISPFELWKQSAISDLDPFADSSAVGNPDADQLSNLLEFAFGTNPLSGATQSASWQSTTTVTPGLPLAVSDAGNFFAVFARRSDFAADGLSYEVEFSADVSEWTPASSLSPAPIPQVLGNNGTIQVVSVLFPSQIPTVSGPRPPRFFRVKVAQSF